MRPEASGGLKLALDPAYKWPNGRKSGEKGREIPDAALCQRRQRAEQVPPRTPKQDGHANTRRTADAKAAYARFSFESGIHRFAAAANRVVLAKGIRRLLRSTRSRSIFRMGHVVIASVARIRIHDLRLAIMPFQLVQHRFQCILVRWETFASSAKRLTSKWNKIEHRMFCHMTQNWRGRPLTSYAVIVQLIAKTKTAAGLQVRAELNEHTYPPKETVTDEQLANVRLRPAPFHGEWNYSIAPN